MATSKKTSLKRARHSMPAFVKKALDERGLTDAYRARPAYQKNDYVGWIKSAKLDTTRQRRLDQMLSELKGGKKCGCLLDTVIAPRYDEPRHTTKETSMADVVTVVAKIRAAKGKGDALAALLKEQAGVVRKNEPGCLVYRPHRSTKDPELFLFYEQYKDQAAFDAHGKAPHLAQYRERRQKEGLTEGAVEVEIYRALTD